MSDDDGWFLVFAGAMFFVFIASMLYASSVDDKSKQIASEFNGTITPIQTPITYVGGNLEQIYETESHNITLLPYNMTNVKVIMDGKVVDKDSYDLWYTAMYKNIPVIVNDDDYTLFLESGQYRSVRASAYRNARLGDRFIEWRYTTENNGEGGLFVSGRYDLWRDGKLIYRKIGILDVIKP